VPPGDLDLFVNILNLAVGIGLMSSAGRLDTFLGLVLPHGLLELTAVFVAAGTGLDWDGRSSTPVRRPADPPSPNRAGPRSAWPWAWPWFCSSPASSKVSSPLRAPDLGPYRHRHSAELAFLAYVYLLGGRAARAGDAGDVDATERSAELPAAA